MADFVERELQSGSDGRPAARSWFALHGKDEASMNAVAIGVGRAFVTGRISYSAGSSFMNALMAQAEWEAPRLFWSIYVAFEDFETREEPGAEAVQQMAETLASAQRARRPQSRSQCVHTPMGPYAQEPASLEPPHAPSSPPPI